MANQQPAVHQQANRRILPPLPFQTPADPRHINPQTGRIQMRVSRAIAADGSGRKDRFICLAEGRDGLYPPKALLVAQRARPGEFRIFDVSKDSSRDLLNLPTTLEYISDARFAGSLHRSTSILGGYVEYRLVRENPGDKSRNLVATTIYDRKSLRFPVVQGTADRIVYSVVEDCGATEKGGVVDNVISNSSRERTDKVPHFKSLGKRVIQHIQNDIHILGEQHVELNVFQSKRRFTNWIGRNVHRDVEPFEQKFQGRALRPSKKNLQIMAVASGKVMLQVGRLDGDNFALDFLPPYTPFQALGVLLAQLDVN